MNTSTITKPAVEPGPALTLSGMTASGTPRLAYSLAAAGFVLSLIGLLIGLLPHSFGFTDCGSGFSPNPYIVWTTQCYPMTDSARTMGLALLVPGVLILVVGLVMAAVALSKSPSPQLPPRQVDALP